MDEEKETQIEIVMQTDTCHPRFQLLAKTGNTPLKQNLYLDSTWASAHYQVPDAAHSHFQVPAIAISTISPNVYTLSICPSTCPRQRDAPN